MSTPEPNLTPEPELNPEAQNQLDALKRHLSKIESAALDMDFQDMVYRLMKPDADIMRQLTEEKVGMWHMASCIPSEGGELFDAIKRFVIYGKPLDRENAIEELGDLEFYMEGLRQKLGVTREDTIKANIIKLLGKRYASGYYSDAQAQARADKA